MTRHELGPALRIRLPIALMRPAQMVWDMCPDNIERLAESIRERGFDPAHRIMVAPLPSHEFVIRDGHHRVLAAVKVLGPDFDLPCVLVPPVFRQRVGVWWWHDERGRPRYGPPPKTLAHAEPFG